jgi:hypothetical protein
MGCISRLLGALDMAAKELALILQSWYKDVCVCV